MGNKSAKLAAEITPAGPLGNVTMENIVKAIMDIVQQKLIHEAHSAVDCGDSFFTSAILRKDDLSEVVSSRDRTTTKNPTATTELNTIESFYELTEDARPKKEDCIFLSVYEPSSIALCHIAIAGFDNFVYLFPRDGVAEPSNISLTEIFDIQDDKYQPKNKYWTSFFLQEIIENLPENQEYSKKIEILKGKFQDLAKAVEMNNATNMMTTEEQQTEA
eukprot:g6419.t1